MAEAGDTSLSALRKNISKEESEKKEESELCHDCPAVCSHEKAEAALVQRLGGILREHVRTGC